MESGVYYPYVIPIAGNFKSLFMELYPLNNMWEDEDLNEEEERSLALQGGDKKKISVYARFCPKRPNKIENENEKTELENENKNEKKADIIDENDDEDVEVTLPLHQRLAMIKMSHNLKSNREALKVLTSEGGKKDFNVFMRI